MLTRGSHERCSELFLDSSFRMLLKVLELIVQGISCAFLPEFSTGYSSQK